MPSRRQKEDKKSLQRPPPAPPPTSRSAMLTAAASSTPEPPQMPSEDGKVRDSVRHLLSVLEPLIRATGNSANLQGMLAYLEEADESFDTYPLVIWVQRRLTAAVQDMIAAEVRLQCRETELTPHKMKMVAPAILHKVMQSPEIRDCLGEMRKVLSGTIGEMSANFDMEYNHINNLSASMPAPLPDGTRPAFGRMDSNLGGSLCSTWNQSHFLFLQPDQLYQLGEQLHRFQPPDVKVEALNTLLITQLGDVISSGTAWHTIKEGLQASLFDSNTTISNLSLKIHSKLMLSISPFATKEAMANICSSLIALYQDKSRHHSLPSWASGLAYKKKKLHAAMVQAVSLLVDVSCDLPRFWSRYPEKIIDDIVRTMLDLVSFPDHHQLQQLGSNGTKMVFPLHLLAAVSPNARWLRCWLHGSLGREAILKNMQLRNEGLLRHLGSSMLHSLEKRTVEDWTIIRSSFRSSARNKGSIPEPQLAHALFAHNVNFLALLLQHQAGYKLVPNASQILARMVAFVTTIGHSSTKGPSSLIVDCLCTLITRSRFARQFFLHKSISDQGSLILTPLRKWSDLLARGSSARKASKEVQTFVVLNACRLMEHLLGTPEAFKVLTQLHRVEPGEMRLYGREIYKDDVIEFLLSLSSLILERHQSLDPSLLSVALRLLDIIATSHEGALRPSFGMACETLADVFMELDDTTMTPTNSVVSLRGEDAEDDDSWKMSRLRMSQALKKVLLHILDTPKGAFKLVCHQSGLLQNLLRNNMELNLQAKSEAFPVLSFTSAGVDLLTNRHFIEEKLTALLETISLEGDNKHWRPSPKEMEVKMQQTTTLFASMLTGQKFCKEVMAASDKRLEVLPDEKVLSDLILLKGASTFTNYCECESVFGLKLLLSLTSNLDEFITLEASQDLRSHLQMHLEQEDKVLVKKSSPQGQSSGALIVDRQTLYITYILSSTRSLGGPHERPLPTLSFEERGSWSHEFDSDQSRSSLSMDKTGNFQHFLKKTRSSLHDEDWLDAAKNEFKRLITSGNLEVKDDLLMDLFSQVHHAWSQVPSPDLDSPSSSPVTPQAVSVGSRAISATGEEIVALDLLSKYALKLGLADQLDSTELGLEEVMRGSEAILAAKKKQLSGFDWFAAVAFFMHSCKTKQTLHFLEKFYSTLVSSFIWPMRGRSLCAGKECHELDELLLATLGHCVELVATSKLPLVYSYLREEKISIAVLCYHWLNQLFINLLDWAEICHLVILVILFGPDYTVYFCCAVLKHLEPIILESSSRQFMDQIYLLEQLKSSQIKGFRTADYMSFMDDLAKEYAPKILSEFKQATSLAS